MERNLAKITLPTDTGIRGRAREMRLRGTEVGSFPVEIFLEMLTRAVKDKITARRRRDI